jgi:hypothetical protein
METLLFKAPDNTLTLVLSIEQFPSLRDPLSHSSRVCFTSLSPPKHLLPCFPLPAPPASAAMSKRRRSTSPADEANPVAKRSQISAASPSREREWRKRSRQRERQNSAATRPGSVTVMTRFNLPICKAMLRGSYENVQFFW